jgi:hypothetical protein
VNVGTGRFARLQRAGRSASVSTSHEVNHIMPNCHPSTIRKNTYLSTGMTTGPYVSRQ